jgi:hypothetical protein
MSDFWGGFAGSALSVANTWANNLVNQNRYEKETRRLEQREDTAIQRRAEDMKAAGINPLLAAGQPAQAAGSPISRNDTNIADDIRAGQEGQMLGAQIKLAEKQREDLSAGVRLKDAQTDAVTQTNRINTALGLSANDNSDWAQVARAAYAQTGSSEWAKRFASGYALKGEADKMIDRGLNAISGILGIASRAK